MAELTSRERLQPSLLDRLTDLRPEAAKESRDERVLSLAQIKAAALRDLGWLLNTVCQSESENLGRFEHVNRSVINFGLPALAGRAASSTGVMEVEAMVVEAIRRYEPRILPQSLVVKVMTDSDAYGPNTLRLQIEGDLWADPLPEALFLRTELDLETGRFTVEER